MIKQMDKGRIIGMKEWGRSNREIARITGYDRKSISKVWNEYKALSEQLKDGLSTLICTKIIRSLKA